MIHLWFQARTVPHVPDNVFRSDNTSTDNDGLLCYGMPCDQWQRVQHKTLQFRAGAAAADGLQFDIQVRLRIHETTFFSLIIYSKYTYVDRATVAKDSTVAI